MINLVEDIDINLSDEDIQRLIKYYANPDMSNRNVNFLFRLIFENKRVVDSIDWQQAFELLSEIRPYIKNEYVIEDILD